MKRTLFSFFTVLFFSYSFAQTNKDSLAAGTSLEELLTVCNSVLTESENPNGNIYERLAPYILYTGKDAARINKTSCDYNKVEDRRIVDKIGLSLKSWLDKITEYKIVKYQALKKENMEWFLLTVSYKPKSSSSTMNFGFIKVKDKFLLGKIE